MSAGHGEDGRFVHDDQQFVQHLSLHDHLEGLQSGPQYRASLLYDFVQSLGSVHFLCRASVLTVPLRSCVCSFTVSNKQQGSIRLH